MNYMTVREASKKWNISTRSINYHLAAGHIKGSIKRKNRWLIPITSEKPQERRDTKENSNFYQLLQQPELLFSMLNLFPLPTEVFLADGTCCYVNQAFNDFFGLNNIDIINKFNVLHDPLVNHKLGLNDYLRRIFQGEILSIKDIKVPYEEIKHQYKSSKKFSIDQDCYQDLISFPLLDEKQNVSYVIMVFMTKRICQNRLEAIKAKTFIDNHWHDEFDIEEISNHVGLSRHHLSRIFKSLFNITPHSYYQEVKIEKIKQALLDSNLNISDVFKSCGSDYSSSLANAFKRKVGMTPSEYRKSHQDYNVVQKKQLKKEIPSLTEEILYQLAQLFPIPIQIFRSNGDIIFINEAVLKMWNVKDTSLIINQYNLINDPFANGQPELKEAIQKVFSGQAVLVPDVKIPLESFWEWYKTRTPIYNIEAIYTDILNFPVFESNGKMSYMIAIFFTSRIYQGQPKIAKVQEYLENNWLEPFDIKSTAQSVSLSPTHLVRLFKKHTGITPHQYYQNIKVARLKEALLDKNLSVSQAFLSCGFLYPGNFSRYFKEQVGMTPSQFRKRKN